MKNLSKKAYMAVIVLIGSLSFIYQAHANYIYYNADNGYATFSNNVSAPIFMGDLIGTATNAGKLGGLAPNLYCKSDGTNCPAVPADVDTLQSVTNWGASTDKVITVAGLTVSGSNMNISGTGDTTYNIHGWRAVGSFDGWDANKLYINGYSDFSGGTTVAGTGGLRVDYNLTVGGNVGIGTAAPAATLHVFQTIGASRTDPLLKIYGTGGGTSPTNYDFINWGSAYGPVAGGVRGTGVAGSTWGTQIYSSNGLSLSGNGYNDSATAALFINSSGNVGIGTTNPGAKLDVNGDLRISGGDLYANAIKGRAGNAEQIWLGDKNDTIVINNQLCIGDPAIPTNCKIGWAEIGGTSGWSRNSVSGYLYPTASTDNVGIGTAIPGAKLDVAGSIKFSSTDGATKMALGLTGKNTFKRGDITADTNYWTGSMGWANTYDWNSVFWQGNGFFDNWGTDMAGAPESGYLHGQGIQVEHLNNGSTGYGWQMMSGNSVNGNWYLRGIWGGGFNPWRKIITDDGAGNVSVSGKVTAGSFSGTLNSAYVSNGAFGLLAGNGPYGFPDKISIGYGAGTTPLTLGQTATLSVSGNVGIETTGSGYTLDVNGTIRLSGTGLYNSAGYQMMQGNATDWLRINQNASWTSGVAAYGNWAFGSGGVAIGGWTIPSAGNLTVTGSVGIGTTNTAAYKLVVKTGTDQNFTIFGPILMGTGISVNSVNDANTANLPMEFRASAFDFTQGNVGIGTTNPTASLQVNPGTNVEGVRIITSNYSPFVIRNAANTADLFRIDQNGNVTGGNAGGWSRSGNNLYPTSSADNVGIGTTAPNARLEVVSRPANNYGDGIVIGQVNGDNSNSIQTYIDDGAGGGWATRTTYNGGNANPLYIQKDAGDLILGNARGISAVGTITAGGLVNAGNYLQINGKYAIDGTDSYLRLNQQNSFSSGVYTPYVLRADGIIYSNSSFRVGGGTSNATIMDANQFYCNNPSNCHFNYSGTGPTLVGNSAGTTIIGALTVGGKLTVNGADVAEEFGTTEELVPGTVVVMGDDGIKTAKPCDKEYDKKVIGVVSDNPSIIMGKVADKVKAIIALTGVVKVKVTTQNGKIERGDLLVTSNLKGYAMKATEEKVGTIIGKALENFSGQTGEITALINLQ